MAAAAKIDTFHSGDRRFASRGELGRPGTIRMQDSAPLTILVRDLTRDGCRIATDAELPAGIDVQIGLAHVGLTSGRIVWRSETDYGCRFDAPLAPGMVTAALGPTNIAPFPGTTWIESPSPNKLGARASLVIIGGLALGSWACMLAIGLALLV